MSSEFLFQAIPSAILYVKIKISENNPYIIRYILTYYVQCLQRVHSFMTFAKKGEGHKILDSFADGCGWLLRKGRRFFLTLLISSCTKRKSVFLNDTQKHLSFFLLLLHCLLPKTSLAVYL